MSEAFDWSRVLKTDTDPAKAAAKEGLAINPINGEPILDKKTPLEVVPGGAPEKTSEKADKSAEKTEKAAKSEAAAEPAAEPAPRTVDVLPKPPTKTLAEIQAEYANKDLFAPKPSKSESEYAAAPSLTDDKPVHDLSEIEPAVELDPEPEFAEAEAEPETESAEAEALEEEEAEESAEEAKLEEPLDAPELTLETAEESVEETAEWNEPAPFIDLKPKGDEKPAEDSEPKSEEEPAEEDAFEASETDDEAHDLVEEPAMAMNDIFSTPEPSSAEIIDLNEATADEKEEPESVFGSKSEAAKPEDDVFAFTNPGDEPKVDMSKHYRPAELPDNIYDIPLNSNKFDVGNEIANLSDEVEVLEDVTPIQDVHLDDILRCAIERKASDIHFTVGLPPMARIDGEVCALPFSIAEAADTRRIVYDVITDEQVQKYEQTHELDFGYGVSGLGRFRFNVYMQRGSVAGALRAIPTKIPSFEDLGLPPVIRDISKRSSGLVLVTGPTGSGKSTTIASMIDDINCQRTSHIITIEDPIEYLHPHKKCMVNQRELHGDTYSFHNALRAVLREDPDIILVGELRDLETIEAALTLAETGHLVFGTLHTRNAPSTIDRIIDVFPSDQQDQIRVLLGNTLEGVVSQQLLPRLGGGRCASIEIMIGTPAIKNLIREGKTHQMYSVLETSSNIGMQTMDASLSTLFRNGYCSYDECLMRAVDKETFARLAKGG